MLSDYEESLLTCSGLHDPGTRMHCERVAELCVQFAEMLRMDDTFIDNLRYAAIFHDVGKIGIDHHILNKPASFNDGEWAMVHKHPEFGESILRPLQLHADVLKAIRAHHENYDGSGYPDGSKGAAIPLMARMIRIADTHDALRTARPDREALDPLKAKAVMLAHQEVFDPVLLGKFFEMLERP